MATTIVRTAWIDDDGTGTTGTIINNAVKTELYNQIDQGFASLETGSASLGLVQAWTPVGSTAEGAAIGGAVVARFSVVGETVFWFLQCTAFTVPVSTGAIHFTLPPGITPAFPGADAFSLVRVFRSTAFGVAFTGLTPTRLTFTSDGGAWAAGASHIFGQGFFFKV